MKSKLQIPLESIVPRDWKRSILPDGGLLILGTKDEIQDLCSPTGARAFLEESARHLNRIVFIWEEGQSVDKGIEINNPAVERLKRQLKQRYQNEEETLHEIRTSGDIAVVTSNVTRDHNGFPTNTDHPLMGADICYYNRISEDRGIIKPYQRIGKSYRAFWRKEANDTEALNPQYLELKQRLERDRVVDFTYRGFRATNYDPGSGIWSSALCEYQTVFTLVEFYGDWVRLARSKQDQWQIIREYELSEQTVRAIHSAGSW